MVEGGKIFPIPKRETLANLEKSPLICKESEYVLKFYL